MGKWYLDSAGKKELQYRVAKDVAHMNTSHGRISQLPAGGELVSRYHLVCLQLCQVRVDIPQVSQEGRQQQDC